MLFKNKYDIQEYLDIEKLLSVACYPTGWWFWKEWVVDLDYVDSFGNDMNIIVSYKTKIQAKIMVQHIIDFYC